MSITSAAASIVAEPNLLFEKFSFFKNSFVSRLHSYIPDICTSLSPTMTCEEGNVYHFGDGAIGIMQDYVVLCSTWQKRIIAQFYFLQVRFLQILINIGKVIFIKHLF